MAIAYVQSAGSAPGGAGSVVAFPSANTPGNLLIAMVASDTVTDTVTALTDTLGNTWVRATTPFDVPLKGTILGIYYAKNCLGGANTVSVTCATGAATTLQIAEYSGADTTSPFDVGAGATANSSTPNSGSATTTAAGDLAIGFCLNPRSALTAGTGYTTRQTNVFNNYVSFEDKILGAAGSVVADGTISTGGQWGMQLATFKAAAGGNTPPVATITAPTNGSSFTSGSTVTFTGTGTDTQDGTLPGSSLAWSSSLDGALGTGTSLGVSTLSLGTHTITLTATDSGSLTGTATITVTITSAGSGGSPNLGALPVANRQKPLWLDTGVNNLRSAAAGTLLSDPVTGVRITKRTSLTAPASSATGYNHSYSSGGFLISKPWGTGNTQLTIYYFADGTGTGYVQDITLGSTAASSARATPWGSDLRYTFSPKAGEEHIVYYFNGSQRLIRYDTTAGVMAEASNATFPAGGKDFSASCTGQQQYIQVDASGRYFCWMNGPGTAIHWWDSVTDTLKTLTDVQLGGSGIIDEPHFDRESGGRYVAIKLVSYTNVGGDYRNHHIWDAITDTFSALVFGASHTDWLRGIVAGPDPNVGSMLRFVPTPLSGGRGASPVAAASAGTKTYMLDDSAFGAAEMHNAGQWDQGSGLGASQYGLASVDAPSVWRTPGSWAVDAGAVYVATVSYQYQQATTQITDVLEVNAGNTQATARLTKAASRGAMVAGTWFISGTSLYVWRNDSAAVSSSNVQAFVQHVIADGLGFYKLDGTDVRFLAHHYSYNPSGDYYTSPRATISPCGRLVVYTSNLHNGTGPHYVLTAEVPLTASTPTALGMVTQPNDTRTGVAHTTQPVVRVVDAANNTVTTDTSTVTAALITVSGTGTALGTLTKAAVAGVADFSGNGLGVTSAGGGTFKWRFTDGTLTSVDSAVFTVVGNASALAVVTQPDSITTGATHLSQPSVKVVDSVGNTVTTDTSTVTASLVAVTGTGSAIGTLTKAAASGIADYVSNGLGVISAAGGTFKWHFADGVLTAVDSSVFTVSPAPSNPGGNAKDWVIAYVHKEHRRFGRT